MTRIATREKAEGKRAAEAAIAEQLGCTPAEAAAILKKHREDELAGMTEAERIKAEATQAMVDAGKRTATAERLVRDLALKDALTSAGCRMDRRDALAAVVAPALPDQLDAAALATAVETAKTTYTEWFGVPAPVASNGHLAPTPAPGFGTAVAPGTPPPGMGTLPDYAPGFVPGPGSAPVNPPAPAPTAGLPTGIPQGRPPAPTPVDNPFEAAFQAGRSAGGKDDGYLFEKKKVEA